MAELIDDVELSPTQTADLREGSEVWIHDNGTAQDIKLDVKAAERLFDFLLKHAEQIIQQAESETGNG